MNYMLALKDLEETRDYGSCLQFSIRRIRRLFTGCRTVIDTGTSIGVIPVFAGNLNQISRKIRFL
jgi:hypothetical protein